MTTRRATAAARARKAQEGGSDGDAADAVTRTPGVKSSKAEAAARAAAVPARRVKVYTPNPLLDNVLTAIYLVEAVAIFFVLNTTADRQSFLIALAVVAAVAYSVEKVFAAGGLLVSRLLKHNPLAKPKTMRKFTAQSWQLVVHASMAAFEANLIFYEMGGLDSARMPNDPVVDPVSPTLKLLYIAQLAVWLYTCAIHRFFDERRKDYFVMYVHHVATIATVAGSAHIGYFRIGIVVLYVHDTSDIFVDLLKMFNYLNLQDRQGFFLSEIIFVVNLASWVYFRLWTFPYEIIYKSIWRSELFIRNIDESAPWIDRFPSLYIMCVSFLCLLFVLHIYWFFLFLRIAYKILTATAHEAGREEYEGDSSDSSSDAERGRKRHSENSAWTAAVVIGFSLAGLGLLLALERA